MVEHEAELLKDKLNEQQLAAFKASLKNEVEKQLSREAEGLGN